MKLGFNEANDRFCKNHSVMMDLELCEKYGFDCIDIQSECLNRDLEAGKITLELPYPRCSFLPPLLNSYTETFLFLLQ